MLVNRKIKIRLRESRIFLKGETNWMSVLEFVFATRVTLCCTVLVCCSIKACTVHTQYIHSGEGKGLQCF